jgi:hypothetical protein
MSTNALEVMRMPELFYGTSTTFETQTINANGANYAVVFTVEESCTIEAVAFNILAQTGGSGANFRIRIREIVPSTGFMVAAGAGLATTGALDKSTLTANANGKMNFVNLNTPLAVTRGQIIAIDFEGLGGFGGPYTLTIGQRMANTYDAIGNRYRFPYGIRGSNTQKTEGSWFGYRSTTGKFYGFNPNSVKSNAADTAGRAYGNFFKCPALGATITCSGMKVVISETVTTDNTIYELWSVDYNNSLSVSLLTSTTLSSGITTNTAGYNKQIFFSTPVNLTAGEYYAITVRSSANSIDYKYLQFEESYFLASMQSFGGLGATYADMEQGGIEINTSTNTQTSLGRLYLMNPLISSINGATTIGSFTANFNSFNG